MLTNLYLKVSAHNPKVTGSSPVPATKKTSEMPNENWAFLFLNAAITYYFHNLCILCVLSDLRGENFSPPDEIRPSNFLSVLSALVVLFFFAER